MPRKTDLSPAELEIMEILWRTGGASVKGIQNELSTRRRLARTTISTLLTRMKEKGYVEAREKDFAYVFRPSVSRALLARRKLDEVVDKVLGGDIAPLAAYIVDNRKLTPEQIRALEDIINSVQKERE